ncbi:carboxymuconolactone decarboxylase family protein [Actinoplanes sp. NPDC049118]|uniref:carboxymuconolactone decarboxylase family protein n=1 Tax=Actinoplanes sp. NPDC049118 TaxID=3155769 RepID=UPI0033CB0747
MSRIPPLDAPYPADVAAQLESMMPAGVPPIGLFRTFARNLPMTVAMSDWGRYQLGPRMSLTMREREIVIVRTCARCRCEYEWAVHLRFFADRVRLTPDQIVSLTDGSPEDPCWTAVRERVLIRVADALHDSADVDDDLWLAARDVLDEPRLLDLFLLCGWYHAISFAARAARAARVEPEPGGPRFADLAAA